MKGHTRLHGVIHHMQHDPAGVEGSSLLSRGRRLWPPFYIFFSIPQTFTGAMTEKKTKGLHVFTETELFYTGILW